MENPQTENYSYKILKAELRPNKYESGGMLRAQKKKTRVYFFIEGENVLENLVNRRSRPHLEYKKLLPKVYEQVGISADIKHAKWDQSAGCSMCPCSPGFVLNDHKGHEIFVTITLEEA